MTSDRVPLLILSALVIMLSPSCGPSEEELIATASERLAWTQTAAHTPDPTDTLVPIPSPTETSGLSIGPHKYELPTGPGWCFADRSEEDGYTIHSLASFCNFTREPLVRVDVIYSPSFPPSGRAAIEEYVEGYESAGFEIRDLNFQEGSGLEVIYAILEMTHPDHEDPFYNYFAYFELGRDRYILNGHLVQEYSEDAVLYLLESMDSIISSME